MHFERIARVGVWAAVLILVMTACDTQVPRSPKAASTQASVSSTNTPTPSDKFSKTTTNENSQTASAARRSNSGTASAAKTTSTEKPTSPSSTSSPASSSANAATGCRAMQFGAFLASGGGYPRCSYTATKTGGYVAQGQWWVTIKRGGTAIELGSDKDPSCSETGLIQPGDEVTARVGPGGYNEILVGDDAHC